MEKYNLSASEYDIMEYLWSLDAPVGLTDIIAYCETEKQHAWKQQTVHTFLSRLAQKGAVLTVKQGQKKLYSAKMTEREYERLWTRQLLTEKYSGSLRTFLSAFSGGATLTKEEKDILKEYLDD